MTQVTFVMEQHIGHRTYYENLRRAVDNAPRLQPTWIEVTYHDPAGRWYRLPGLPASWRGSLTGRDQVRRGLRQQPYEVAFFNTQVPAALAGRQVQRRPYLLSTDITPRQYDAMAAQYGHRPDPDSWFSRYKHRVNCHLFQQAACLLPWSTWVRQSLVADYGVDPGRVEVVPPGIDLDLWQPGPPREAAGPLRILFVGGDLYRKGGALLLEAFRSLPAGLATLTLVTRATDLAGQPGITVYNHLQPNSAELIDLYRQSDVFVLPTQAEAFGIAAIEASASGMPVIATATGGLVDIVLPGQSGFLIQPDDPASLARHLRFLAGHPVERHQMGQVGRERTRALFDARRNAARVVALLFAALRKGRNR